MRHAIDLKRMRHVLETARAETITTAAETLGVTQSALSRSIAEVEQALGTPLFHRLPRGIQLTQAGERFVEGARRLLGDMDALIAHVRETEDLGGGRLRIGVSPAGWAIQANRALQAFAQAHPGVALELITGSTQSLCPRLLHGELDMILGSSSYLRRWRELEIHQLSPMRFAVLSRKAHPLTRGPQPAREIDVLSYPLILPESVEPMFSDIAQRFAFHGLPPPQPRYSIDDFEIVKRIIEATDAIYPLHSSHPQFGGLDSQFALLQGALKMPETFISVAYSSTRPHSAAGRRFEELLMQSLAEMPRH